MKRSVVLAWAAGVVVAAGGCHTSQPEQRASSNVLIRLSVTGSAYGSFVYNERIGGPDRPTSPGAAQCDVAQTGGQDVVLSDVVLPWPTAVEIQVFRGGVPSSNEGGTPLGTLIGQTSGFSTITGYDSSPVPAIPAPDRPPDLPTNTYYTDGHLVSTGSREYYERCSKLIPWPVPDPSIYAPVQILFQTEGSPTYEMTLQHGDTLIVKAQKQGDQDLPYRVGKGARITGDIFVDGASKVSAQSDSGSGAGITMTYTLP